MIRMEQFPIDVLNVKLQTIDSNPEKLWQVLNENLLKSYTTLRVLGMSTTVICF